MKKLFAISLSLLSFFLVSSCHDEPDDPTPKRAKRTVLIYAVASNNLETYLIEDRDEMFRAADAIEGLGSDVRVLLYSVASQSAEEATLAELTKNVYSSQWYFRTIQTYDRNTFSTDPVRMKEVFADLRNVAPSDSYGLVFWSHATGWIPKFSSHEVPGASKVLKSFGIDKYSGVTDYCDLAELADAIPNQMFDYIWFDACYMMGIETVYQLRDKCDYLGGYPSEDWIWGMDYETTLPMLAAPVPDLVGVGKAFFDFYNNQDCAVTVTVLKTEGLESIAAAAADIYAYGTKPESSTGLQNYSREQIGMYDLRQFTEKYLDSSDPHAPQLTDAFNKALDEVILYADCSTKDFNRLANSWNPDIYSGLSCHFPGSASAQSEQYFNSLDWSIATNP